LPQDWRALIERDRLHASVIFYSFCNGALKRRESSLASGMVSGVSFSCDAF
jgi:hypothetical protein